MPFTQKMLDRVSTQTRNIYNIYAYRTDDTITEVKEDGYFSKSRFKIIDGPNTNSNGWENGIILCDCADGYLQLKIVGDNTENVLGRSGYRASWRTQDTSTITQTITANNTPETIFFSDESLSSPFIEANLPIGEFLSNINATIFVAMDFEVFRDSPGGDSLWGVFIEVEISPGLWIEADNSLRVTKLKSADTDDIENISFSFSGSISVGLKFRLRQITDSFDKTIGIISGKPFTNAPAYSGAIFSIDIFY